MGQFIVPASQGPVPGRLRQHPGDTRDYVVEIAAGRELIIDVYSRRQNPTR
ncbi:MAG: hypothetical protein ABI645_04440 [Pseudomonadota bacterium]